MEPTVKIDTPKDGVLILLQGQSQNPINLKGFEYRGTIEAPLEFFKKRKKVLDLDKVLVVFDTEEMFIKLETDPSHPHNQVVIGVNRLNPELVAFGINEGKMYDRQELLKLCRFNRLNFNTSEEHATLITKVQKLEVSVQSALKDESDNRANKSFVYDKVAKSELPENFKLKMPLIKGKEAFVFTVDLCFDASGAGVQFWFESVELKELLKVEAENLVRAQIDELEKEVVCIEQ